MNQKASRIIYFIVLLIFLGIGMWLGAWLKNCHHTAQVITPLPKPTPKPTPAPTPVPPPLPKPTMQKQSSSSNTIPWQITTTRPGDSLAKIFSRLGIAYTELLKILKIDLAQKYLKHIHPQQKVYAELDKKHQLLALKYTIDNVKTLLIRKTNTGYQASIQTKQMTTTSLYKSGVIHSSLAKAAQKAGLTPKMFNELKEIFRGHINYTRDLRPGDHFSILYEEYYVNGKKYKAGDIIAAEFTNKGHTYSAIRYADPQNHTAYYTPDGHGIKPLFLKAPLNYTHISGHFNPHRFDPILKTIHPHLGIDYAAKWGTPIKSIGDGVILYKGKKGGYGNAVMVKYNQKYRVLYGHLSRFAKNLHAGEHIKQSQVIGYVGSSGWSTGPHLHYELYVWGIPKNPMTLKLPDGNPVPRRYKKQFTHQANQRLAELKIHEGVQTANAE